MGREKKCFRSEEQGMSEISFARTLNAAALPAAVLLVFNVALLLGLNVAAGAANAQSIPAKQSSDASAISPRATGTNKSEDAARIAADETTRRFAEAETAKKSAEKAAEDVARYQTRVEEEGEGPHNNVIVLFVVGMLLLFALVSSFFLLRKYWRN